MTAQSPADASLAQSLRANGPLALVCAGGSLPFVVADSAISRGRQVVIYAIRGYADPKRVENYRHHWIAIGQAGRFRKLLAREGCRDVVFIGSIVRPAWTQIRFDLGMLMIIPKILAGFRGGDNHLLTYLSRVLLENYGLRPLGAHEVAPDILVPAGTLGGVAPRKDDHADIAVALDYLNSNGRFDTGQAVVVGANQVLAVEAAEGTDGMIERVTALRDNGRIRLSRGTGVLVKAPKPQQDRRFDLPTIGPKTVEGVARAGLAGLAVVAGETVIVEPQAVIAAADKAGVFVIGIPAPAVS
jgi:DUF1009 family protein